MASFGSVLWLHQMMAAYGLWILFGMVFLESAGVPLPGAAPAKQSTGL